MPRTSHDAPDTLPPPWHWSDDAVCKQHPAPDIWFPEGEGPIATACRSEAKRECRRCTVIGACLHHALLRREPYGIWGGLDETERAALVRPGLLDPGGGGEARDAPETEEAPAA